MRSRRGTPCKIGDDTYPCDADEQTVIFVPILPPPAVPCSSPAGGGNEGGTLDVDLLCEMLDESAPRPAPLVWKLSPDDSLLNKSGTTTRLREKRLFPSCSSVTTNRLTKRNLDASSEGDSEGASSPPPLRAAKKRKVPNLRIDLPLVQHERSVVEAAVALYSLKSGRLISVGEWKTTNRVIELEVSQTSFAPLPLPVSSSRDDPLPLRRGPSQQFQPYFAFSSRSFTSSSSSATSLLQSTLYPLDFTSTSALPESSASSSRRASLASSTSTATSVATGASFFYGGGVVESAEGSVTSVDEDEEQAGMLEGRKGFISG
ncbi:hypothetical protein JCM11251_002970 [Rhodosporidiobolus azoricus]